MKKIKTKIIKAYRWVKTRNWRRMFRYVSVILFSALLLASYLYVGFTSYDRGHAQGQRAGQCQVGCAFLEMDYEFFDEDGTCWCASGTNAYYAIPLQKEY